MGEHADDTIQAGLDEEWNCFRRYPRRSELAAARCRAHDAFDPIWQSGEMTRSEAYVWLAEQLGVRVYLAHIKRMNIERCEQVVEICTRKDFEDLMERMD